MLPAVHQQAVSPDEQISALYVDHLALCFQLKSVYYLSSSNCVFTLHACMIPPTTPSPPPSASNSIRIRPTTSSYPQHPTSSPNTNRPHLPVQTDKRTPENNIPNASPQNKAPALDGNSAAKAAQQRTSMYIYIACCSLWRTKIHEKATYDAK